MEKRYGTAPRIWGMDRGMVSEENLAFLRESGQRVIIGTPKAMLKSFEQDLRAENWRTVREGVEVKSCTAPDGSAERFLLCRSQSRREKEQAMHARFAARFEDGLKQLATSCETRVWSTGMIERRVGKLLGANSCAAGLFAVRVTLRKDGRGAQVTWTRQDVGRSSVKGATRCAATSMLSLQRSCGPPTVD